MEKHRTIREGDEYACSCGLRWDIDEDDPHVVEIDEEVTDVSNTANSISAR